MKKYLLILLTLASAAWATSFYPRSMPETLQDTPVLVRGRTGPGYGEWALSSSGNRRLFTYYDLQIEEILKGDVQGRTIQIRELGGEKDGIGLEIAGAAHFEKGEDVVVTLGSKNPDGSYDVRGLSSGKFNVKVDDNGKEYIQSAITDGDHGEHPSPGKWSLESLRKLVAQQAQVQTPARPSSRPSPTPSASVEVTTRQAPQLQPSPVQGASQPEFSQPETLSGLRWILRIVGLVLAIGLGISWMRRRGK